MSKAKNERKVRLLRLTTGGTAIANVLYRGSGFAGKEYELTKAMEVIVIPQRGGQNMLTLMDFIPGTKQEVIELGKQHVMCTATPQEKVADLYQQATNPSPIAQPATDLVLPPGAKD